MKKLLYSIIAGLLLLGNVACDSFLDQQPIDKQTTAEDIFTKKSSTDQYFNGLFRYIPKYWTISADEGWGPLSDEAEVSFNHNSHQVHQGSLSPASPLYKKWGNSYKGIRETNYFLANVHMCKELTEHEMEQYIATARFLRAYYYFLIIRNYGPVVLMGDLMLGPEDDGNIGRSPLDECVNYVCNELYEAAKVLDTKQPDNFLGRRRPVPRWPCVHGCCSTPQARCSTPRTPRSTATGRAIPQARISCRRVTIPRNG